jgi:hypothetical protein
VAKANAEIWSQNNDVLNWRYGPLYLLLRVGVAHKATTRRAPGTLPESPAIRFAHHEHSVLLGADLEALAKVVEEHIDVRVA